MSEADEFDLVLPDDIFDDLPNPAPEVKPKRKSTWIPKEEWIAKLKAGREAAPPQDPEILKARGRMMASIAHEKANQRKQMFIDLVVQGKKVQEACDEIGIKEATYLKWRQKDKEFKSKVDFTRVQISKNIFNEKWSGTFAEARLAFFQMDTFPHQLRIVHALEYPKPRKITMILLPPAHGKTTLVEDWVSLKLGHDPNHRITIVSESIKHTRKMIRRVQKRMNPGFSTPYTSRFGPFYEDGQEKGGKPWTAEFFTVAKASHDERDFSVEGKGWTSQIYGARVDTLIIDDIQSVRSMNSTAQMVHAFRQDMLSRLSPDGQVVIVGTRIGMGDFYETLIDEGIVDELIRLPAINVVSGEALWPQKWPVEMLEKVRTQVGDEAWFTAYQQNPAVNQLATFNETMIDECKDDFRTLGATTSQGLVAVSLDPALGGGNALTAGNFLTDRLEILDCQVDYSLARTEDILGKVADFAFRYKPRYLIVERDAMQKGLARDDRLRELASTHGFDIVEHLTRGQKGTDSMMGVASMAGSFVRKEIGIPWADSVSRARMEPLITQLRAWRPNVPTRLITQDLVMSLWFMWLKWMTERKVFKGPTEPVWTDIPSWMRKVS